MSTWNCNRYTNLVFISCSGQSVCLQPAGHEHVKRPKYTSDGSFPSSDVLSCTLFVLFYNVYSNTTFIVSRSDERLFRWSRVGFFLQGAAGKKGIKGAKGKKVILPVDSLMMMKPPCHFLFPAGICSLMRLFLFYSSSSLSSSREAEVTVETKDRLFLHFHFSTFTSQRYKNNRFLERKRKMCLWCWGGLTDLKTHFVWKICDVTQNL